eukprot:m.68468 g.68468  ORF g.68468 m.68468 type:complete len:2350 (+) comp35521_c0_seq7:24-7073(+)
MPFILLVCFLCLLQETGSQWTAFQAPDFRTSFTMASQAGKASFREIVHGLGVVPFLVRVYARPEDGNNKGFAFEAVGSAQTDDDGKSHYGGIVYAFDKTRIRLWAPTKNDGTDKGRIVWIGAGWAGDANSQDSQTATVVVEAWKTGRRPSWTKSITMTSQASTSYQALTTGLQAYPNVVRVEVEASGGNNQGFVFYGTGAGQTDDDRGKYGGVVFAYSHDSVRLWTAHANDGTSSGYCIFVDDGWGGGINSQLSTSCDVTVSLWMEEFPPPTFVSSWIRMESQKGVASYKEIWHGMGGVPVHLKVQVQAVDGSNSGFVFEGIGSVMGGESSGENYGGLAFAYDSNVVRLWAPSNNQTSDKGKILYVEDGWGDEISTQASNTGMVRVSAWKECTAREASVEGGHCKRNDATKYEWVYGNWGNCSIVCGSGTEKRTESGCLWSGSTTAFSCDFGENSGTLCGFQSTKQDIAKEIPEWKLRKGPTTSTDTGPDNDHTTGSGFYAYTETSNIGKGGLGILTSPDLQGNSSCALSFYWLLYGMDVGVLYVQVLSSTWTTVWELKYQQGLAWRRAWIPFQQHSSFTKIRFVHEVGTPSSSKTNAFQGDAAIDDVLLVCKEPAVSRGTNSQCMDRQYPIPGCVLSATEWASSGSAYKVVPNNGVDFVKAAGISGDVIAEYRFNVIQPGGYLLWMEIMGNSTSTKITMDGTDSVNWIAGNVTQPRWQPNAAKVYQLGVGIHAISIEQISLEFYFSKLTLSPQKLNSYDPLGLQSFFIPDSSLSASNSLASVGCSPSEVRLYGSGWCSDDVRTDTYIQIQLPQMALISHIAYQGLPSGKEWTKQYQVEYSLDGTRFDVYKSGSLPYEFKENVNEKGVQVATFPRALPAKAVRIVPTRWQVMKALRIELYGVYMEDGVCASSGRLDVTQPCTGDARCSLQGKCNSSMSGFCLCNAGFYGKRCEKDYCVPNECSNNGTCIGTLSGFDCDCEPGYDGKRCLSPCNSTRFGRNCAERCNCSEQGSCNPKNGNCSCYPGYAGLNCEKKCPVGKFGLHCNQKCLCQNRAVCDHRTGKCNCSSGFYGLHCSSSCNGTTWDAYCTKPCDCKNGATCDGITGRCFCLPGFNGTDCSQPCPQGLYGAYCISKCKCQENSFCDGSSGDCTCTSPGFTGPYCSQPCPASTWGVNCQNTCRCNNSAACNPVNGTCTCTRGWTGKSCSQQCPEGFHGFDCLQPCTCKNGAQCDRFTSTCSCFPSICTCHAGWKGPQCSTPCSADKWGVSCLQNCTCSAHGLCNQYDGSCDCLSGYVGVNCDISCPSGKYGDSCSKNCSCQMANTKVCRHVDGFCTCKPGWMGVSCSQECSLGYWGLDCAQVCKCENGAECNPVDGSCTCTPGYQGKHCDVPCLDGYYGIGCTKLCRCAHGKCNNTNGACTCNSGWAGVYCDSTCPTGYYGLSCSQKCNCNGGSCDHVGGTCSCNAGYTGPTCNDICPTGTFGLNCSSLCSKCSHGNGECHHVTGHCPCAPGYIGLLCTQSCPSGKYGIFCQSDCKCVHGTCDHVTGSCSCNAGYTGDMCTEACNAGWYGNDCALKCKCIYGSCDPIRGACACSLGYIGTACDKPCSPGKFGQGCSSSCNCLNGSPCNNTNGICDCLSGWTGPTCNQPCASLNYGRNCRHSCNCFHATSCNRFTGDCYCSPGWQGPLCEEACVEGFYGVNCSHSCSCGKDPACHHVTGKCYCPRGFTGAICNKVCSNGWHGRNCSQPCQCKKANTVLSQQCDPMTGKCNCLAGYTGDCHEYCPDFTFGLNCSSSCECFRGDCDPVNGSCGCLSGFTGVTCNQTCPAGKYGQNCLNSCDCLPSNTKSCSPFDGTCNCLPGYRGIKCEQDCPTGWFGDGCSHQCNCTSQWASGCDGVSGKCLCSEGWMGPRCEIACLRGWYGPGCIEQCQCANNATCDRFHGNCDCQTGFTGKYCTQKCTGFTHGNDCGLVCNCSDNAASCDHVTGVCLCKPGYQGPTCSRKCALGLWGTGCSQSCPVCSPHIGGSCRFTDGSCVCLPGFNLYLCTSDCPKSRYGSSCNESCMQCENDHLCNHIHGDCQSINNSVVSIEFSAAYEDLLDTDLQAEIKLGLARLFSLYSPAVINSSYLIFAEKDSRDMLLSLEEPPKYRNSPLPGTRKSAFPGQFSMAYNEDFVARIIEIKPSKTSVILDFVVYYRNWPVLAGKAADILDPVPIDKVGQYFPLEVLGILKESPEQASQFPLLEVLLATGGALLVLILVIAGIVIYRISCRVKSRRPPVYEYQLKDKSNRSSQLSVSSPHHFDNLYYDVMTEIELENNIDNTFINPVYERPEDDKETEVQPRISAVCEVDTLDTAEN